MVKKNPIEEARRYVENAKTLLVEHGELDEDEMFYNNKRIVKQTGNMLWKAVILVLDAVYHVRHDRRTRIIVDDYLEAIGEQDEKLYYFVDSGCDLMYVYMGYNGTRFKSICDDGFWTANQIIDRCATMLDS